MQVGWGAVGAQRAKQAATIVKALGRTDTRSSHSDTFERP
jgi:hypothetical protein